MTDDRRALIYGLTAILAWSTVATAFKLALRELDVYQLLFYAVISSALALLAIVWRQGKLGLLPQLLRQRPGFFLFLGLLNPVLYYLILFRAYDLLPAQQAQPINYTWAITLALLAIPFLGQRLSGRDVIAAVLGYSGVLVIATQGRLLDMKFDSVEGVMFALLSTLIWACYWIANTRNQADGIASLCLSFILATPVAFFLCVGFSTVEVPGWRGLTAAIYVGFLEMGVTYALWGSALRLASNVARVGNLIFLSPLISLIFIALILGETIHPATLFGLALIIPGVLIQQMERPAPRRVE